MKVALTSSNKKEIAGKADDCLKFWIYTIENKKVVEKQYLQLGEGQNLASVFYNGLIEPHIHPIFEADMLLTNDISAQITARLKEKRTVAFIVEEKNIEEVIEKLIAGTLEGHIAEEHNCNCGYDH